MEGLLLLRGWRADRSGVNTSRFTGKVKFYAPATNPPYADMTWDLDATTPTIAGRPLGTPAVGIVDSGSPWILGPNSAVAAFHALINESVPTLNIGWGNYVFECNGGIPDLRVAFSVGEPGDIYEIESADLVLYAGTAEQYAKAGYGAMEGREGWWCWSRVTTWSA